MPGEDAPQEFSRAEVDALLRAAPWGEIRARLVKFAMFRTKNRTRAEDLAQNAIMRVLDAGYKGWNPRTKELLHFLMNLVKDDLTGTRKSARVHREIAMSSHEKATSAERAAEIAATNVSDSAQTPETALVTLDMKARRTALLRERLEVDDPMAIRVLGCIQSGLDRPAEIAVALDELLPLVVQARDRLVYQAKKVARDLADEAEPERAPAHEERAPESAEGVA